MLVELILQVHDYFQEFKKYIEQNLLQKKDPTTSCTNNSELDYTIYLNKDEFDSEMDDFYRLNISANNSMKVNKNE
jgi:hypothetical protein